ncbi:hypothetical protein [Streptomyces sp. RTd22]|uniref:hypothetical protein n=1 Tax=Streptomyces sp. RTd22 TaxID=1841249 RepID=UPI000B09DD98|nr:hypothetical protein [Streptomyces sp. RTd22]
MSWNNQPSPTPAPPAPNRPRWARKRIAVPAAAVLLFVGVGIGSAQGDDTKSTGADKPAPRATVTVTAKPARIKDAAEPAPTVTVTKTVTAKPKPKPKATESDEAPAGTAVFKVWGSAPAGADITYGSDSDNLDGSGLPMTKTLKVQDGALYYHISAQLQGGGDIRCSVTIDGQTKTGHARGSYNICSAQLNGDFSGGWD